LISGFEKANALAATLVETFDKLPGDCPAEGRVCERRLTALEVAYLTFRKMEYAAAMANAYFALGDGNEATKAAFSVLDQVGFVVLSTEESEIEMHRPRLPCCFRPVVEDDSSLEHESEQNIRLELCDTSTHPVALNAVGTSTLRALSVLASVACSYMDEFYLNDEEQIGCAGRYINSLILYFAAEFTEYDWPDNLKQEIVRLQNRVKLELGESGALAISGGLGG
jgi:hypothetical protein